MLFKLILSSLWSRRVMAVLTCSSIGISMLVLIGVDHFRYQVKDNFERTVSGVDLIVGSRTSGVNLLLFSVFKIGNPSNNVRWDTYQEVISHPQVAWSVPLSMGDSHRGYSVIGSTKDYFQYFKYGNKQQLTFSQGSEFNRLYEVVLGAEVAKSLNYTIGSSVVMAHGTGKVSFTHHDEHPFNVVGILQPTGTPIDQSLFIPLQSIDILHRQHRVNFKSHEHEHEHKEKHNHEHEHEHEQDDLLVNNPLGIHHNSQLSAFLLGAKNRIAVLQLQRAINQNSTEPLTAIMPAITLRELWKIVGAVEVSLKLISWLILATALICMTTMLLASMKERERELAILRALGASASIVIIMVLIEALLLTLVGALAGYMLITLGLVLTQPLLEQHFALYISPVVEISTTIYFFAMAAGAAVILSFVPALLAYKKSLNNGLKA